MAGSHRATTTKSRKKPAPRLSARAIAVAAVVALVPAAYFGAQQVFGGSDDDGVRADLPIPPVTTPAVSPSSTPAPPAPSSSSSPPPATLTAVPTGAPRRLTVAGLLDVGFDDSIEPDGDRFTAGSTAEAARWGSRGLPGSPGTDTVFLVGKTYTAGASAFDDLPSVGIGDKIRVRTDAGMLTYTVQDSRQRPAAGLVQGADFTSKVPGRLVLVGILFDAQDDARTGKYLVVVAQLSAAERG